LIKITEIKKLAINFFVAICLLNCTNKVQNDHWDKVEINPSISRNSVYKELDKRPELFSALETSDALMKRSSDVAYFTGNKMNLRDNEYTQNRIFQLTLLNHVNTRLPIKLRIRN